MRRSSLRAPRGRRVLLWAGLAFVLAQLGGGLLLDYRWPDLRFPAVGRVFGRLERLDRPPEIVVMGSSRFEGAVRPDVLDPLLRGYTRQAPQTFNAAVGAGDPIVAERLLDRMLRAGHRPAMLVLEVSPEHFSRRSPMLSQQVIRQMTWADLPSYLPDACLYTPMMRLLSSRLMPLYMHRYQIRKQAVESILAPLTGTRAQPAPAESAAAPCLEPNLDNLPAAEPAPPPPLGLTPAVPAVALVSDWLRDYQLGPVVTTALERLLARCRAERIDVLLVGVPVMAGHRAQYKPEIDAVYLGYVHSLIARYGCRFVDFRDRVPDYGFRDALHTNDTGSVYFSHLLGREVLIPLWRELHP